MQVPKGFSFNAVEAGIKYQGRPDVGLIFSEKPSFWSGVFTKNDVKAAPVILGLERLRKQSKIRAILVNSGCANACTGEAGLRDAEIVLTELAKNLNLSPEEILPASTGVIGSRLPVKKILAILPDLVEELSPDRAALVARAMMTTDTFPKIVSRKIKTQNTEITLLGLAKGAGMIAPNMATMLAFILTDAKIPSHKLRQWLAEAVEFSFNRITVDGDTSTNDTVYLLANGLAGEVSGKEEELFKEALFEISRELAYLIVKDGEGATKTVKIRVEGARSEEEALKLARAAADSPLVKTAFFGEDPNWGRIMVALGKLGLGLVPEKINIFINDIPLVKGGLATDKEDLAQKEMARPEFTVKIELGMGAADAEILTCDLSKEYVKINAEYRT
ncbi:bifunctional glutamate N-acetyltransferase/amino-acid acetyltransferase ArgJ [Thermosulfurimonas dismutans]|uniref:Arginine biosynthesis bifunctional protein ArgJ n=1 Tax=Thermosulfurimonas dismutans TaxID=999894 RepID=A0A179D2W8_9BACT|nr:bifunctional glutamate N-acetyltransferase/amino-acid acetyltransferase ArgJ [Thermosulfurimonas dismutans]OAQ20424.1 Glutamate N-acetyltransferase [Thermosulfurimonas dismutans]